MVLHQVKNWQNWKMQGCFMQFLRLIFVKKLQIQLQGASPPHPHRGRCPLDPHWGPSAAPCPPPHPPPPFSADFSIFNSHACYSSSSSFFSSSSPFFLFLFFFLFYSFFFFSSIFFYLFVLNHSNQGKSSPLFSISVCCLVRNS